MRHTYFAVQQLEKSADIYIFGDIVRQEKSERDVATNGIIGQIKALDAEKINVYIDSYGGAVSEGWAVYNALREHPAQVDTYGMGFVASAAVFPFLAGENRYASNISAYYLHQVMIGVAGYAEDLRAAANEADMMTEIGIHAFVDRTNMNADTVRELMRAETWLTPDQALEHGIATAILADTAPKYTQDAKRAIMQSLFQTKPPREKQEKQKPAGIMQTIAGIFNN